MRCCGASPQNVACLPMLDCRPPQTSCAATRMPSGSPQSWKGLWPNFTSTRPPALQASSIRYTTLLCASLGLVYVSPQDSKPIREDKQAKSMQTLLFLALSLRAVAPEIPCVSGYVSFGISMNRSQQGGLATALPQAPYQIVPRSPFVQLQ